MRKKLQTLFFLCFTAFTPSIAQQTAIPKLEISKGDTYVVGQDNTLRVDTLIMQDKAIIKFNPDQHGVLEAKVAIIGNKCVISSKGSEGRDGIDLISGENGGNGGDLSLVMHILSLGKLTIDTRGGSGGAGVNGKNGHKGTLERTETKTYTDVSGKQQTVTVVIPGEAGTNGTDATHGGNSGNGGNVSLTYSTNGFIPVFNNPKWDKNSIVILHTAGSRGRTGEPGKGGTHRMDGAVVFSEVRNSRDGRVQLINLNNQE